MVNKNLLNNKGFTIIELVVVMAVFLFIVGASLGIFISVIQSQKRVLAEQQMLNQISYVNEYMSKALRMAQIDSTGDCLELENAGYIYLLTREYSLFFTGIKFIDQNGDCREFFVDTNNPPFVVKELKDITPLTTDADAIAITSTDIQFDEDEPVRFAINGSSANCGGIDGCGASDQENFQPRVTFVFNINVPGDKNIRAIQTTVSQRNLNIDTIADGNRGTCTFPNDCGGTTPYCVNNACSSRCGTSFDCAPEKDMCINGACYSLDEGSPCKTEGDCSIWGGVFYCINHICRNNCSTTAECKSSDPKYVSCLVNATGGPICSEGVYGNQCWNPGDCASGLYCSGTCMDGRSGDLCDDPNQCQSRICDGVCQ